LQDVVDHEARDAALRTGVVIAVLHAAIREGNEDHGDLSGSERFARSRFTRCGDLDARGFPKRFYHGRCQCIARDHGDGDEIWRTVSKGNSQPCREQHWEDEDPEDGLGLPEKFAVSDPGELHQRVLGPTALVTHREGGAR
jgi:hypothetical protein